MVVKPLVLMQELAVVSDSRISVDAAAAVCFFRVVEKLVQSNPGIQVLLVNVLIFDLLYNPV